MKLARITLLLLCVVSPAALLLRPSERPALLAASPQAEAYGTTPEKSELAAPAHEPAAREASSAEPKPEPSPAGLLAEFIAERFPERRTQPATEPQFELPLQGHVIATDDEGVEWHDLNGHFVIDASWDEGVQDFVVPFKDGQWQTILGSPRPIQELAIEELKADGRSQAIHAPRGDFPVPASGEFVIRARLAKPATLRVVDKASGRNLAGLSIVGVPNEYFPECRHPGEDWDSRVVSRDLQSPISLDALAAKFPHDAFSFPRNTTRFHLGAEGYPWRLMRIDLRWGGETLVKLKRSSRMEVYVTGADAAAQTKLRVVKPDSREVLAELTLDYRRNYAFDGLEDGEVFVSAEIGPSWKEPLMLDQAAVSLRSGKTSSVSLTLPAAPIAEYASASGTIRISKAWADARPMVVAQRQGLPLEGFDDHQTCSAEKLESPSAEFDDFRWELPRLLVGSYVFTLHKLPLREEIALTPAGLEELHWILPSPVEVTIQALDRETGQVLHPEDLNWGLHCEEVFAHFGGIGADYDESAQAFVFLAPETEIDFSIRSQDTVPYEETVQLAGGPRHHVVHLKPACGVVLSLECNGQAVSPPDGWRTWPTRESSGDSCFYANYKGPERRISFRDPGVYTFELPKLPGYRQTPTLNIAVEEGKFVPHVVQLERDP